MKETVVAGAEVVETGLTIGGAQETIFGTLAMTGEEDVALATLTRHVVALDARELLLARGVHEFVDGVVADVAKTILGEDEMVAGIDIAIVLDDTGMTAVGSQGAESGRQVHPVGKCGVEDLDEELTDIATHPLVEHGTEEVAPLLRGDAHGGEGHIVVVGGCQKGVRVGLLLGVGGVAVAMASLDDGCELKEAAAELVAEELIEACGLLDREIVDDCHGVPLDAIAVEEVDALGDQSEGGFAGGRAAVGIVPRLRSVDGHTDEPVLIAQKATPVWGEEGAIGLYAVFDMATLGIVSLQLDGTPIEGEGAHERLAAMPREEHVGRGLGLDILPDEELQGVVGHDVPLLGGIETGRLLEIVAVVARQIAMRPGRLRHDIERRLEPSGAKRLSFFSFFQNKNALPRRSVGRGMGVSVWGIRVSRYP